MSDQETSKRKPGRPSAYKPEFVEQAYKLCLLGATDVEIADFFEADVATLYRWKNQFPEFCEALKGGKRTADANIAHKLYQRAEGYEWTEEQAIKVKDGPNQEHVEVVEVRRATPPDTTAIIFWLKNRRAINWRDKQEIEHTVRDAPASELSDEALEKFLASGTASGAAGGAGGRAAETEKLPSKPSPMVH